MNTNRRFLSCFFVVSCLFTSVLPLSKAVAHEGLVFNPTALYYTYRESSVSGTTKLAAIYYDLKLGYAFANNFYLGAIYSGMNRDYDTQGTKTRTSYGVSVGYFAESTGLYVMGHYYISSEYDDFSSVSLKKGSGYQADLGYFFTVNQSIKVGPQLTYRGFKYAQQTSGGVTSSAGYVHNEFVPFVSLGFFF
jgi:hypothetical protein